VSTVLFDAPVDLDELRYQCVVDEEFRALVLADPGAFGITDPSFVVPTAVARQDRTMLDLASGAVFASQCISTCTGGPFTIICDGTTK
jgi:hypothetical protein